ESAAASDASDASTTDAAPDAPPGCVMPPEPQCDADIASDLANCGACGHRCLKQNGACSVGICDVENAFYFPFVTPVGIALDDLYFYGVGGSAFGGAEGGAARAVKAGTGSDVLALYTKDPRRMAISKTGADL